MAKRAARRTTCWSPLRCRGLANPLLRPGSVGSTSRAEGSSCTPVWLPSPWSRRWSCSSAGGAGEVAGVHKQRGSANHDSSRCRLVFWPIHWRGRVALGVDLTHSPGRQECPLFAHSRRLQTTHSGRLESTNCVEKLRLIEAAGADSL